jgi:hypothetical protein
LLNREVETLQEITCAVLAARFLTIVRRRSAMTIWHVDDTPRGRGFGAGRRGVIGKVKMVDRLADAG